MNLAFNNSQSQVSIFINHSQYHKQKKLIINADDFGYSKSRDKGILQLIQSNQISSISVLVNGSSIKQSSQIVKNLIFNNQYQINFSTGFSIQNCQKGSKCQNLHDVPQNHKQYQGQLLRKLSIGLHFNITEGKALCNNIKSELLCQSTNQFRGKAFIYKYFQNLRKENKALPISVVQLIKVQFRLQIQQFISLFQFRPSHIDGHNHIHVIPQISKIIAPLMAQNGIYRVRIPQQQIQDQIEDKNINFMNKIFIINSKQARQIFDKQNIIYTSKFIGLQQINKLNPSQILRNIEKFVINETNRNNITVELMCHPGYSDPCQGDEFNQSKNRQVEMNSLKSKQFQQKIFQNNQIKITNFNYISPLNRKNEKSKILLYSKMNNGSGNWTTSLRLRQIFQSLGFEVYLRSIQQHLSTEYQIQSLKQFLIEFKITLVVGINLTRSGKIIYNATRSASKISCRVPYIFIVAGTDANIYFSKPQASTILQDPIKQCSLLISLSESMLLLTQQFMKQKLNFKENQKQIILLSQSSNILAYQAKQKQQKQKIYKCLQQNWQVNVQKDKYIVFPASFRAVKDVQFLLNQFNILIEKFQGLRVFILGPILNQDYYQKCFPKLGKVQYLGSLQKQIYVELLKNAFFLVNSSVSEGQCCSIQEGLEVGQICVVRNNQGNAELIKHMETGFLFNTPEQFLQIFYILIRDQNSLVQKIKQNAIQYHKCNFSVQTQAQNYKKIFEKLLPSKQKLLTYPNVHPVSQINLQLYNQIPEKILMEWFKNQENKKRIIDIGCGSGIFGLSVLGKFSEEIQSQLELEFYDIDKYVLSNCYYNCLQQTEKRLFQVKSIKLKVSDMLSNIQNPEKGNLYIANLPQTPFQHQKTKPDKNGGPDSLKFNEIMIRKFSQFNQNSVLIILYSYMSYPKRFFSLLEELNLQIQWESQRLNHYILTQSYDLMEQNLSQFLKNHIKQGRAQVQIRKNQSNQQTFVVPAQILIIRKKKSML